LESVDGAAQKTRSKKKETEHKEQKLVDSVSISQNGLSPNSKCVLLLFLALIVKNQRQRSGDQSKV
jgi:hypothetical protein